ncbi:Bug family tripartite tricarboxylate transporter substrate binding protein [Mesorhizobium sp. A556]
MTKLSLSRRDFVTSSLLAAGLVSIARPSFAEEYPSKPIQLLVGYGPGGMDTSARLLAHNLTSLLGQSVVVDNRPGATGMIAAELVARAPADGYTLLFGESGLLTSPQLQPAPVDPFTSFEPVAGAFIQPLTIVVNNDLKAKTPKEFLELLKANPGKFTFATSGIATTNCLGFEMLKARTGIDVPHVPYRGAAAILTALIAGEIQIGVVSAVASLPLVRAGQVRAIGFMTDQKLPGAEDIPPMSDVLPGFEALSTQFLLAPAGTPPAIVERVSTAIRDALSTPELAEIAAKQGNLPWPIDQAALGTDMRKQWDTWGKVIKEQNIKIE